MRNCSFADWVINTSTEYMVFSSDSYVTFKQQNFLHQEIGRLLVFDFSALSFIN